MVKKSVYADNAATTRISKSALDAMMPYLTDEFGNASAVYGYGRRARRAVETAREKIALTLGCSPCEIYFTSGGTESDNWALTGVFRKLSEQGKNHIITTAAEHHAVLHTCEMLKKYGAEITYLPVNPGGRINPDDISAAITDRTALVSVMYANNETGVIQPVNEAGQICSERGVLFHTDAVQAVPYMKISVHEQNIDLLSVSSHKLHGPKGIGALYIREGTDIAPFIYGGEQENRMRAGTENTASAAGFGQAVADLYPDFSERNEYIKSLRDRLMNSLLKTEGIYINGDTDNMLPGHCSISVKNFDAEQLLLMMDLKGICASAGSACTSGDPGQSHVLKAMGLKPEYIRGALRFSLDQYNTAEDVDYISETLTEIIRKLKQR